MAPMRQIQAVAPPFLRARRFMISAAVALVCLANTPSAPAAQPSWEHAQQLRAQLNAKPAPRRTRADYDLVITAYKAIYHGMPSSPHAVDSILATAEVLEDEGHVFRDAKLFHATINEYVYLRQHYPSNPHRAGSLLAEAHVEQHDLRDTIAAEQRYRELIDHYPNSPEAGAAHASLAELDPNTPANAPISSPAISPPTVSSAAREQPAEKTPPQQQAHSKPSAAQPNRAASRYESVHIGARPNAATDKSPSANLLGASTLAHRGGPPAKLSSIRQLVNDDSVQLVFDLSGPVSFKTGRATNPTRLYFDLENTHIDRALTQHPMVVSADPAQQWLVHRIRAAQFTPTMARVVLEVDDGADAYAQLVPSPWRLMIDLHSVTPPPGPAYPGVTPPQQNVSQPGPSFSAPPDTRQPQNNPPNNPQYYPQSYSTTSNNPAANLPPSLDTIARPGPTASPNIAAATMPALNNTALTTHDGTALTTHGTPEDNFPQSNPASPTTTGGNSTLVRALGLKINRVVIDAGHGGRDTGTIGPGGLLEKDVVLDIALRLGAELQQRLGVQVTYTRSTDVFVPLEERTAIANNAHADLFISIHGNSSPETNVRGVETYYLSLTNQQDSLAVAARENATSAADIHDLSDIVKRIAQTDKMEESRELALDVQQQLFDGLVSGNSGLKNRGIRKAPFVVLIGANMPSILTEISFVTNSKDAKELRDSKYRERIADSLYKGVAEYMSSLSSSHAITTQTASRRKK